MNLPISFRLVRFPLRLVARGLPVFLACAATAWAAASSDAAAQTEVRLREALRTATLQLRTVENERIALQIRAEEAEKEAAALRAQLATQARQAAAERDAAAKTTAALDTKATFQGVQLDELKESLAKAKLTGQQAADLARETETARAALAVQAGRLERKLAERHAQNVALVGIASEILSRFEKFGLGDALAAREPFIGTKRVELANLVQDYGDKIDEQKATPRPAPAGVN